MEHSDHRRGAAVRSPDSAPTLPAPDLVPAFAPAPAGRGRSKGVSY